MKSPLLRLIPVALATSLLAGCEQDSTLIPCGQSISIPITPAQRFVRVKLQAGEECAWPMHLGQKSVQVGSTTQLHDVDVVVDIRVETELPEENETPAFVHASVDGQPQREPGWVGAFSLHTGEHVLRVSSDQAAELRFIFRYDGETPITVSEDHSLEWLPGNQVIDTTSLVGFKRMMGLISEDGHGGRLLEQWLSSFDPAGGPSRPGPAALLSQIQADQGTDPAQWDMDLVPFAISSVQNRIDLRDDATSCGTVRVVLTSTGDFENALHLNFLFKQVPVPLDYTPAGTLSCAFTALRWVRLSAGGATWLDSLYLQLEASLRRANFLHIQSSEKIGAETDYEFREWVLATNTDTATAAQLPNLLVSRPMFQAVDTERLNLAGPDRDAFIAFVTSNAESLAARTAVIPEAFLAVATRADGLTWVPLDLTGVPTTTLDALPQLRQQIEIVGCNGCHTSNSGTLLVHSRSSGGNRAHSPFMGAELSAREQALLDLAVSVPQSQNYGPLQANPVLPP